MTSPTSRLKFRENCGSGIPVALAGIIALGAGILHASPLCAALGLTLFLVPAGVFALLWLTLRRTRISHVVEESAFEGDTVEVSVFLHNRSRFPLFYPAVAEVFSPEVFAQKTISFPYRVIPGETVLEVYRGECMLPRGVYGVGPAAVSASDPLGWFRLEKRTEAQSPIKVYPRFDSFGVGERLGACLKPVVRDVTRFGIGESNEFFSVREYRFGDPLRRVHWGLTAHRGYPVVRENTRTAIGDLSIYLDLYRFALLGVGRGSSLEQSVKIAASIASHALQRGHRVQLMAHGKSEVHVAPGSGTPHLQAILDALVDVKPDGRMPLHELLDQRMREALPGGTALFMVSPYLETSEKFRMQLLDLRRKGVRVVLVVFDSATYRSLYEPLPAEHSASEYADYMSSLGMETFLVPCAADLPAVFLGGEGKT